MAMALLAWRKARSARNHHGVGMKSSNGGAKISSAAKRNISVENRFSMPYALRRNETGSGMAGALSKLIWQRCGSNGSGLKTAQRLGK